MTEGSVARRANSVYLSRSRAILPRFRTRGDAPALRARVHRNNERLNRSKRSSVRGTLVSQTGCREPAWPARDEVMAAAAQFAAQRAWSRAQQSNPLHPQGWHAWIRPSESCSLCVLDMAN